MEIKGKRINLRSLRNTDAESIYKNIKDRDILRFLASPPIPYKLEYAKDFILKTRRQLKRGTDYSLGIEDKETGDVIGMISIINVNNLHKRAEIGYWLGKKYHRQGIMNEALGIILRFSFKSLKLHCLSAGTFKENIASQNLLKKHGFQKAGTFRKYYWRNNRWNDDVMWQLLYEDYKK